MERVTPPICTHFPVVIPPNFVPSDSDCDGVDHNAQGRQCPGYKDPYGWAWGGGFWAARGPQRLFHRAVDVMAAEGAHLVACTSGIVPKAYSGVGGGPGAGFASKSGNYVVLVADDGWIWYHAHMRDLPLVKAGDRVEAGQLLGYVGRTGNAKRRTADGFYGCPHLHLSLTSPARLRAWIGRGATKGPNGETYSNTLLDRDGKPVSFRNEKVDPTPWIEAAR